MIFLGPAIRKKKHIGPLGPSSSARKSSGSSKPVLRVIWWRARNNANHGEFSIDRYSIDIDIV